MNPLISIVIPNYNSPHIISTCLKSLETLDAEPSHEVVVVDNGSTHDVVAMLQTFRANGIITALVPLSTNQFFSGANNAGVRMSNPASEYILLLNSDVAVLKPNFLGKMLEWMNGVPEYKPNIWGSAPTKPSPGPRDIISFGWSYDEKLPSKARPEGWCCMIRRKYWFDMSTDFAFHNGFEEAIAKSIRAGAKCGVLFNYANWCVHREGGSGKQAIPESPRQPDMAGWFANLTTESLDFTLGPREHDSYLVW